MKKINFKTLIIYFIRVYQLAISPYLGNNCRYYPTCSKYAIEAIEKNGLMVGIKMAVFRILRCNPWGGSGIDMVSDKNVKNKN
jgi:hypothetical protein